MAQVSSADLSAAVQSLLGWGIETYPKENQQRVLDRYGPVVGAELVECAQEVLRSLDAIEPDPKQPDLSEVSRKAVATLKLAHPDLDTEAAASLEWAYSWWWK